MQHLTAFVSGCFFAVGLAISGMIDPAKVIGFLAFTGAWDPTLGFVMAGALAVFMPAYRLITRRERPVVTAAFDLPTSKRVTTQLVVGAAIFGVGWGVSGMCPAAAIAAVPALSPAAISVVVGMSLGIVSMRVAREALAARMRLKEPAPIADF